MAKATTTTEATVNTIEVKLGMANNVHLPALRRLFNMIGGSLTFKRKLKKISNELDAKIFEGLAAVREASGNVEVAGEEEKAAAKTTFQNVLTVASEKVITLDSPKLLYSELPDETTVLARTWNEQLTDSNTGAPVYRQGDYITDVASLDNFFTEE
jgi:hypothetical protein